MIVLALQLPFDSFIILQMEIKRNEVENRKFGAKFNVEKTLTMNLQFSFCGFAKI